MLFNCLHIVCFFGVFALYNAFLVLDDKTPEGDPLNKKYKFWWHFWGAIIFLYICYISYLVIGLRYVPFVLANAWLLFAGIVHRVALKQNFFYVGTTAGTDLIQQWIARKLHSSPTTISLVLKVWFYIMSIIYLLGIWPK